VTAEVPGRGIASIADVQRRTAQTLAVRWPGSTVRRLSRLPGGASSLTYLAEVTGAPRDRVVVKMAPPGLAPVRNRDVLRQARVLQALAQVPEVAVPQVHATDAGDPPDIPPLFVMDYVDGESYEPLLTAPRSRADLPTAEQVESRALAAVQMLAALHRQGVAGLGLADEPVTSLPEECARWAKAFATCELTAAEAELETECRRRLVRHQPVQVNPVILHGDWRLGNMQCQGGAVRAVIDWEIWSVGDPRTDLAWMMLMADREHPSAGSPDAFIPLPRQLLAWYETAANAAVGELDWVQGLMRYKQGATSALLVKNAQRRGEAGEHVERLRSSIRGVLQWALTFLT
jgi:aminoglycoside phosphotransferase (APT) family kinase protein